MNMQTLPSALFANILFVPLWIIVLLRWRVAPATLRHLTWCALAYLVAFVVGAVWQEVRLLLPLFPLLLPVIVYQPEMQSG
jgi:hypothetical protein